MGQSLWAPRSLTCPATPTPAAPPPSFSLSLSEPQFTVPLQSPWNCSASGQSSDGGLGAGHMAVGHQGWVHIRGSTAPCTHACLHLHASPHAHPHMHCCSESLVSLSRGLLISEGRELMLFNGLVSHRVHGEVSFGRKALRRQRQLRGRRTDACTGEKHRSKPPLCPATPLSLVPALHQRSPEKQTQ